MKWKQLPLIAFDTETTGLDPYSGDKIIEVALVVMHLGPEGRVVDRRDVSYLINPGIPIPRKITQITGIADDDVASAPRFETVAAEIAEVLGSGVAIAHNYPFDAAFLTAEFSAAGHAWQEPLAAIDTVDLSMKHFKEARSHKLGDVAKRLDVSLENAHRATDDAAACGYIFAEMVRRHEVGDDLQTLLDWADAIGRPPEDSAITVDQHGVPTFAEGEHEGEWVYEHPLHLAWMEKARVRTSEGWAFRYPPAVRGWVRRFLNVRASGRAKQNPKSFREGDWVLDPCIVPDRRRRSSPLGG